MKEENKGKNYFELLNSINVSDKTEKKNGLTYLSWAWAWGEVKKIFPNANYKIYETETGINYWNDGRTAWVKTGVVINEIEHIEYLPIMDFRNKSIPVENITSFDVNKAIQRSLTKAVARHGLGLYIYAGEDLPENEETPKKAETKEEINYREELVTYIKSKDLDFNSIAKEHKLNAKSSQESFKKVLEKLQEEK
jgi:hypothetical protein